MTVRGSYAVTTRCVGRVIAVGRRLRRRRRAVRNPRRTIGKPGDIERCRCLSDRLLSLQWHLRATVEGRYDLNVLGVWDPRAGRRLHRRRHADRRDRRRLRLSPPRPGAELRRLVDFDFETDGDDAFGAPDRRARHRRRRPHRRGRQRRRHGRGRLRDRARRLSHRRLHRRRLARGRPRRDPRRRPRRRGATSPTSARASPTIRPAPSAPATRRRASTRSRLRSERRSTPAAAGSA